MDQFGHKVLTPFGFKLIDDIAVGDAVINPDGTTCAVVAVKPTRKLPCYRVTFTGGASVIVDEDHLWTVKKSGVRTRRKVTEGNQPIHENRTVRFNEELMRRYKTMTTQQLAQAVAKNGRTGNYSVPLMEPANFQQAPGRTVMMPPYLMGVLIGDGAMTSSSTPNWTKPDPQVAEEVATELRLFGSADKVNNSVADPSRYSIVGGATQAALKSAGLFGCGSHEKFIPKQYLNAPIAQRWALINGLMDTDGYADDRGQCSYSTTSEKLRDDFAYLAGSLGFATTATLKPEPTYAYLGEKRIGRPAWEIYITGRDREKLFRLARKKDRAKNPNNECGRLIESVELLPEPLETRCISVSHPNSLYVTNGFAVTHNTYLAIGLAITQHRDTLILRREAVNTKSIVEVMKKIPNVGRWRSSGHGGEMRTFDGRLIEIAGCQHEDDKEKFQGRPHDLIVFDEVPQFSESMVLFIGGWNRNADPIRFPNQRCRVIGAGNPPMNTEGEWIRRRYAPWLEGRVPPGKLLWYTTFDGDDEKEREFESGDPVEHNGHIYTPKSRTFIPARLEDNPQLMATGYGDTLNNMPEPLRSMLRKGSMTAGSADHSWQLIPTRWVAMAQKRWQERKRPAVPVSCLGVDPARSDPKRAGGTDDSVIARRFANWIDNLVVRNGKLTPDGSSMFALAFGCLDGGDGAMNIDAIGIGASVYDKTQDLATPMGNAHAFIGGEKTEWQDRKKLFKFRNCRSAGYWKLREWLDPEGGPEETRLALPPDAMLAADLCAPRWRERSGVIQVEPKESDTDRGDWGIKNRLGRSPDRGDAVMMACWEPDAGPTLMFGRSKPSPKETLYADMKHVANSLPGSDDTPAHEALRKLLKENPDLFTVRLDALEREMRPRPAKRMAGMIDQRARDEDWA